MKQNLLIILFTFISVVAFSQSETENDEKKLTYNFSGFVNLNTIFDFNGLDNFDDFTTSEIPINPSPYENTFRFHMTARQSRLNFKASYKTPLGNITGFISGDFYSGNTGNIGRFRLREAYLELGRFLLGQTNTSFGNPNVVPATVDFEGPNSAPTLRNPMIKYTSKIKKGWSYSIAIEMRGTDILPFAKTGNPFLTTPTLVTNIYKSGHWGTVTLSGMADITQYFNADSAMKYTYGYGGALSAIINTWEQNHFSIFLVGGKGIADFISDLSGNNYNGVPDITTNKIHMLNCFGGFVGYTQAVAKKVNLNLIYSYIEVEKTPLLKAQDFSFSQYALINLFYNPFPRFVFGAEFIYGKLTVQDNQNGTANRLQFLAQFNF